LGIGRKKRPQEGDSAGVFLENQKKSKTPKKPMKSRIWRASKNEGKKLSGILFHA
jgi:hypothetical protein